MFKQFMRLAVVMLIIPYAASYASGSDEKKQTLKIENNKTILLVLKMMPPSGRLVIKTGTRSGEVEVSFPVESQANVTQDGNTIVVEGQKQVSTYTVRVPRKDVSIEVDVNGKKYNVSHGFAKEGVYNIDIK